jgi:site-specific recombinase
MDNNSGAIAGNFFFGIMLGGMGTLGMFFGLPLDIRHVTFSSANFSYALVALDYQMSWQTALISLSGVALIGMVNLAVSFTLALFVAMKARQVRFGESTRLLGTLWRRFRKRPRQFFLPPSKAEEAVGEQAGPPTH